MSLGIFQWIASKTGCLQADTLAAPDCINVQQCVFGLLPIEWDLQLMGDIVFSS